MEFHRALFKTYFTDLSDISDPDVLASTAESVGLDSAELRTALEEGRYRQQVIDGINWSRSIGVTAIPTFIFDEQYGIVGAQDYTVLQSVMQELGRSPRA